MAKKVERSLEQYVAENPNGLSQDQFRRILDDLLNPRSNGIIHDETFDYFMWLDYRPGRQELFCKYILEKYKEYYGKNVLEVGCGRNATLSVMLSKHFHMTAIDPELQFGGNAKISLVRAYFTQNTPIWDYDLVIGLEPCDATEHIIRSCLKRNKEFIVVLCGVPHRRFDGRMPKSAEAWYDYLVNIDAEQLILEKAEMPGFNPYVIRNRKYD